MATIVYSMSGEGRGHATRVRTVVEELRTEHRLVLLATGAANEFLNRVYEGDDAVQVHAIPGLQFHYTAQRLNYLRSLVASVPFLLRLHQHVDAVTDVLHRETPDLAISDFEPLLPRAAKRLGLPFLSFDHQHFLTVGKLANLPWRLRWRAWLIGLSVNLFCRGQRETIVSSFFELPVRRFARNVTQVGVLLRPEILRARPVDKGFLLVYLRRFPSLRVLEALRVCGRQVRVYGLGEQPPIENLSYCAISEEKFLEDLAQCHAVISNAGNQLVGEALYLRKPVLALPEPGNFEQAVNGHFLEEMSGGITRDCERFKFADLREFLDLVPALRRRIDPKRVIGNQSALAVVRRCLLTANRGVPADVTPIPA